MKLHILVLFSTVLYFTLVHCVDKDGPQVDLSSGSLRGKYMKTIHGRKFNGFLGIPFAKPPLGELRFQEPQNVDPWKGVKNAATNSDMCVQMNVFIRSNIIQGQEDCLYLNVYTPQLPAERKDLLPVMVFYHGGGWICGAGTSDWYGPDILLDKDIVLVVPNYRLGAFGFISTNDDIVPGNMGMKDQVFALQWVQDNIKQFGGDPNSVTIFGESAGGASVHYHMMSPLTKNLVHRGISESGTALCPWALAPEHETRTNTVKLAEALNCPIGSSEEMIECLKKIDAQKICQIENSIFLEWDRQPMIPFKPMIEHKHPGAFLTEHPVHLIKNGKTHNIPWIAGITESEGALFVSGMKNYPHLYKDLDEDFNRKATIALFYDKSKLNLDPIMKKIRKFYFGNKRIDENVIPELVNMITDGWFADVRRTIHLHVKHTNVPVYYYYFAHRGVASYTEIFGDPERDYGTCHADELIYLFPIMSALFPNRTKTESDERMTEILSGIWTNFAIKGNPNFDDKTLMSEIWKPVSTNEVEYLHIKNDVHIKMEKKPLEERFRFWSSLGLSISEHEKKIQDEL